ncbi:sensor histidine kinase [Arenimonas fontis]|uniref:Sensor histidine kinase n=1 Tax=Arenimonas fontis TaxID=2608255 RepID=A0A5B2Z7P6_9GAMM|nr:sensor histidine kinase [Arenimonas fontis]KAA2284206.1 sensor histidine kinase [Arenimonas fontis]
MARALAQAEAQAPPRRAGGDIHDSPWVTLIYCVFVFAPLAFVGLAWKPWLASLLAFLLFLPLHFRFYRPEPTTRRPLVLATALIGFALVPFNPGGNTFLVYACAMAGWSLRPRRAVGLSLSLMALLVLEFFLVLPWRHAVAWSLMATLVSLLVLSGVLLARDKARRDAELRLTQEEVGRLAALAERERIGRDLHDLLGHTLSVVALKSELAGKLLERDPPAARAQIAEVETVARQALAQVREAVTGIRASGLMAELAAARLALLSAEVHMDQKLAPVNLSPEAESALALGLREAVTNVLRHAEAGRVEVELKAGGDGVALVISDDGRGGVDLAGNGLTGMRERLAAVGGCLDIDSPPGEGTRLVLSLPARGPARGRT